VQAAPACAGALASAGFLYKIGLLTDQRSNKNQLAGVE
jgi:hypothetical protein